MKQFVLFIILSLSICSCKIYNKKDIRDCTKTKPPINLFDSTSAISLDSVKFAEKLKTVDTNNFEYINIRIDYPERLEKAKVNQELRKLAAQLGVSLVTNVSIKIFSSKDSDKMIANNPVFPIGSYGGSGSPLARSSPPPNSLYRSNYSYHTLIKAIFVKNKASK